MDKSTLALLLILCGSLLLGATPGHAGQECAEKVLATCTKCHYQTRICEQLEKKSERDWRVTITRMLRYGLVFKDTDQYTIIKCLMTLSKNSGDFCK